MSKKNNKGSLRTSIYHSSSHKIESCISELFWFGAFFLSWFCLSELGTAKKDPKFIDSTIAPIVQPDLLNDSSHPSIFEETTLEKASEIDGGNKL